MPFTDVTTLTYYPYQAPPASEKSTNKYAGTTGVNQDGLRWTAITFPSAVSQINK